MTRLAKDTNAASIQVLRPTTTDSVSISGTAATSAITADVTRIVSDTDCFYSLVGTATTSSVFLPAYVVEFVHTYSDDTLSIITSSATGTAYVTHMI
jgi:hypothetical protein